jgi:hypothetical protein
MVLQVLEKLFWIVPDKLMVHSSSQEPLSYQICNSIYERDFCVFKFMTVILSI